MRDVFVVSTARTPVGKRNGYLRNWMAPELLGHALNAVVDKIDLDPNLIEDVVNGTVYQVGEQGFVLGRMGVFASKLPDHVPGRSPVQDGAETRPKHSDVYPGQLLL